MSKKLLSPIEEFIENNIKIDDNTIHYRPRLKQIFGNENAIYAFENFGCGFRLLRIVNKRRLHDLRLGFWDETTKRIGLEADSDIAMLKFASIEKLIEFVQLLPAVYPKYKFDKRNIYVQEGNVMTNEEIHRLIFHTLNHEPVE